MTMLDLAHAQFTGFCHAKKGYSAKTLATSMGLNKSEWGKLRGKVDLPESDKQDIDALFLTKKK